MLFTGPPHQYINLVKFSLLLAYLSQQFMKCLRLKGFFFDRESNQVKPNNTKSWPTDHQERCISNSKSTNKQLQLLDALRRKQRV